MTILADFKTLASKYQMTPESAALFVQNSYLKQTGNGVSQSNLYKTSNENFGLSSNLTT